MNWRMQTICSACLALCLVVVPVQGAAFAPHGHEISLRSGKGLQPNGNSTAFLQGGKTKDGIEAAPNCIQNTGGTCAVEGCAAWRGPVTCEHMRCFCPPRMCAGADGKCYSEPYKTLLRSVRIRNMRWKNMYMYLGLWGYRVYVGEDRVTPASSFKVRQLPDGAMLLSHNVHGEWVVSVQHHEDCDNDNNHCTQRYTPETSPIQGMLGAEVSAITAAVEFTTAPDGQSLMISGLEHPGRYLYVPRMSWTVDTYLGDPGTSGHWQFDPPLPIKAKPFSGRRCSYDCGGSRHASPMSCMMVLSLLALSVASLS